MSYKHLEFQKERLGRYFSQEISKTDERLHGIDLSNSSKPRNLKYKENYYLNTSLANCWVVIKEKNLKSSQLKANYIQKENYGCYILRDNGG